MRYKSKIFLKVLKDKDKMVLKITSKSLSMSPLIYYGDSIAIERNYSEVSIGDIILTESYFGNEEDFICHRIIKNSKMTSTKGDNNRNIDYYGAETLVLSEKYIGTIVEIIKENYSIDLKTKKSKFLNRCISKISSRCIEKKNIFYTELIFTIFRLAILFLLLFYTKKKRKI